MYPTLKQHTVPQYSHATTKNIEKWWKTVCLFTVCKPRPPVNDPNDEVSHTSNPKIWILIINGEKYTKF